MLNSFYDHHSGLVYSFNTERRLKPFLWGVDQATKNGRNHVEDDARKFHNDKRIEFDRKIKIMNRDQKAQELYYGGGCKGVGWEYHLYIQRHHAFTQILGKELRAVSVIQRAFRWYRYYPKEKFCNRVQLRAFCDIFPEANFETLLNEI